VKFTLRLASININIRAAEPPRGQAILSYEIDRVQLIQVWHQMKAS
jgi:hypothetical protein